MHPFYDWENRGLVACLADRLEAGHFQLFCVDQVDRESWYAWGLHPAARARRHAQYDEYLLREVLPFTREINPHPFLIVEVRNGGDAVRWKGELDNRHELVAIGMTADTLKPGDRVILSGNGGRTQPQSLYVYRLDRPADGFWYEQVGMSPRIGRH